MSVPAPVDVSVPADVRSHAASAGRESGLLLPVLLWAMAATSAGCGPDAGGAAGGAGAQRPADDGLDGPKAWTTFAYDQQRTGCPDGSAIPDDCKVLWRFAPAIPISFLSSPAVVGDRVVAGCDDGRVYCLDIRTGRQVWSFTARHLVFSSPVVADGRVYFGEGAHVNEDSKLYCVDLADGRQIWNIQTEGHTEGAPLLADGKVYFSAGPDGFLCADARTGKRLWQHKGPHPDGSPVLVDGKLIFGTGYEKSGVYCVDAKDGRLLWHRPTDAPCWGTPSVSPDGKTVVFGTGETRWGEKVESKPALVHCLNVADGKPVWTWKTSSAVMSPVLHLGDEVVVACADGRLAKLKSADGTEVWTRDLKKWVLAGIVRASNGLVVTTQTGTVMVLDPKDGRTLRSWEFAKGGEDFREGFVSTPALVGGRLYLPALDGRVWCVGREGK